MSGLTDNTALHRFELPMEGLTGFVTYRRSPGVVTLLHAEVPAAIGGRGYGSRLAAAVLDQLRAEGVKVVPVCGFIAHYIQQHPGYADLLPG